MKPLLIGSCNSYGLFPTDVCFKLISEVGMKNVEILTTPARQFAFMPEVMCDEPWYDMWQISISDLRSLLNSFGLKASFTLCECDVLQRKYVEALKLRIQFAQKLGIKYFGIGVVPHNTYGSARKIIAHIQEISDMLSDAGMVMLIESLAWIFNNAESCNNTLKQIKRKNVKIIYNLAHAYSKNKGLDAIEEVKKLDTNIGGLFLKDFSKVRNKHYQYHEYGGGEWNFCALGRGMVDFSGVFNALKNLKGELPCVVQLEGGPRTACADIDVYKEDVISSLEFLRGLGIEL